MGTPAGRPDDPAGRLRELLSGALGATVYRGCSCRATTEIGSAVWSWLCRDCSGDRGGRAVDVFIRRRPVRNRHPQHVFTVPGGPAEPTGSVPLDRGDGGAVGIVAAGQADQHLVEHHVVENLGTGNTAEPLGHSTRLCAVAFDHLRYPPPAE